MVVPTRAVDARPRSFDLCTYVHLYIKYLLELEARLRSPISPWPVCVPPFQHSSAPLKTKTTLRRDVRFALQRVQGTALLCAAYFCCPSKPTGVNTARGVHFGLYLLYCCISFMLHGPPAELASFFFCEKGSAVVPTLVGNHVDFVNSRGFSAFHRFRSLDTKMS